MENRVFPLNKSFLLTVFAALMLALCTLAFPATAMADESDVVAHSVDEATGARTDYTSISDAVNAGYAGQIIVMDTDWSTSNLEISSGKKITIDMNGHTIKNKVYAATIRMRHHSELTLMSSKNANFSYKGYNTSDGGTADYELNTGGLVTTVNDGRGGIVVDAFAKLTLDGVAVAGCEGNSELYNTYGGVRLWKGSTLDMKNNAVIEHNWSGANGGGVYADGDNVTINMNDSSIRNNWAKKTGGGIYFNGDGATLTMSGTKDASRIEGNGATGGGGIQFGKTNLTLKSEDGKAYVSNNSATSSSRTGYLSTQSGGGIHVEKPSKSQSAYKGLIEGITISENYSAYDGGGIELDQQNTTIRNCKIINNVCKYEGGAIYVCNNGNFIDGCTITGNACSVDSGGNYEGGAVFVWHSYDIKLGGVCVIKNNTRGKNGSADDVFLREDFWSSAKAYITGSLSTGSTVGVRTGMTDDRRIAKNFKPESKNCLFIDLDGYYVSYGNDEGGDAWQRHRELAFAVKINGKQNGRYKYNEKVTLTAPDVEEGTVFWCWDTTGSTGLNPVNDYINDSNRFLSTLTFTMPQNDVSLSAAIVNTVKKAQIDLQVPVAGEELSATATIKRTDDGYGGNDKKFEVLVNWYEVASDGTRTAVIGKAKAGATYVARLSAAKSSKSGFFYDEALETEGALMLNALGEFDADLDTMTYSTKSVALDSTTGTLTAESPEFTTKGDASDPVETGVVTVNLKAQGFAGNGDPSETASIATLSDDAEPQSEAGLIDTVNISYDKSSETVTIAAPTRDGYNFCNWESENPDWIRDDVEGIITVPVSELDQIGYTLTAVYTPVVTEIDVEDLDAPAIGKTLVTSVSDVRASCSDKTELSFADLMEKTDGFKVTWSPVAETASYSTTYTAVIELGDGEGLEDVEKVLAEDAVVTCNGTKAVSAGFAIIDGKLCLAVTFSATPDVKATSVAQPEVVELTFDEAKAYSEQGSWPLPKTVDVKLENDETIDGDITWDSVDGFDADATAAQELTVKGTITHVASEDAVDTSGVSLDVSTTIKVAAPSQSGNKSDGDTSAANLKTDSKSALAKAGSFVPAPAVAMIAAIMAIAGVVVVIAAMRRCNS